jgi:small subunit ribosomal protein S17
MRFKSGVVIGTKMAKTVTVEVARLKAHPKYKKQYRVVSKFYAHNEDAAIKVGDTVIIMETRPMSKLKRWVVITDEQKKAYAAQNLDQEDEVHAPVKKQPFTLDYKKRVKKAKATEEATS